MNIPLIGIVTGMLFGFLLQRTEVLRYDRQIGALRLMDFTIMKFMISAIISGMIGIFLLQEMGIITLKVKATVLGTNVIGGLIFGLGWGILGYCPGTAAGAFGEGRIDALWGMAGMVAGSCLFAEFYPYTTSGIFAAGNHGKISLMTSMGLSPAVVVATALLLLFSLLWALRWFDN